MPPVEKRGCRGRPDRAERGTDHRDRHLVPRYPRAPRTGRRRRQSRPSYCWRTSRCDSWWRTSRCDNWWRTSRCDTRRRPRRGQRVSRQSCESANAACARARPTLALRIHRTEDPESKHYGDTLYSGSRNHYSAIIGFVKPMNIPTSTFADRQHSEFLSLQSGEAGADPRALSPSSAVCGDMLRIELDGTGVWENRLHALRRVVTNHLLSTCREPFRPHVDAASWMPSHSV
jgi:hypothetical protein